VFQVTIPDRPPQPPRIGKSETRSLFSWAAQFLQGSVAFDQERAIWSAYGVAVPGLYKGGNSRLNLHDPFVVISLIEDIMVTQYLHSASADAVWISR